MYLGCNPCVYRWHILPLYYILLSTRAYFGGYVMETAKVEILRSVETDYENAWNLCFQWVRYHYGGGKPTEMGYRFIWKRTDGSLQPARGQARIPNAAVLFELIYKATDSGWFIAVEKNNDNK